MSVNEIATLVKDIIVALSAAGAAVVAIIGLTTWKKELKGKSEYQLAKECLMAAFRVREGFNHVRSIWISSDEFPDYAVNSRGELNEKEIYDAHVYIYENRWRVLQKALNELEEKNIEAQVEWGSEHHGKITKIRKCADVLQREIKKYLGKKKDPSSTKWLRTHLDPEELTKRDDREMIIIRYQDPEGEFGEFTKQVNEAIYEFEEWLRPKVK